MPLVAFAFTDRALDFLDDLAPKLRRQVIRKAKALHATPFPPTAKRLQDVTTPNGEPVFRERAGDYRILYLVRKKPEEVIILDIDHRKDVYRMPKTAVPPTDEMKINEAAFDEMMRGALGVPAPPEEDAKARQTDPRRLAAYPAKPKKTRSTKG